jgi:hypothetical protein
MGLATMVAAVGMTAATAGPVSALTPASTATATARILPYAGDSQILVYGTRSFDKTLHNYDQVANLDVELHLLTKAGKTRDLVNTGTGASTTVSVVGQVAAVFNANDDHAVRWWDAANNTHGSVPLAAGDGLSGAAPNGFVYEHLEGNSAHLFLETFAGHVTDLGDPLGAGVTYSAVTGPDGILATQRSGDVASTPAAYLKWTQTGKFHELHNVPGTNWCNDLGTSYAACGQYLLPLSGAKPIKPSPAGCTGIAVVFRNSSVRICSTGRLHRIGTNGKPSQSTATYADQQALHAFDRLIVSSPSQSKLESLTSINAKPKVLLTASAAS